VTRLTDVAEYPLSVPVSWMPWFPTIDLSQLSEEPQDRGLERLKDKAALVHGRSGEKKSVTINKR
jgi:hypothetical protein